jgi:preprotein translocase subunit YajC
LAFEFVVAMGQSQGAPGAWVQLMPFVLVLAIFYFIILLPMRRRQQKVQSFLAALKVGDRVVTSGGLYGTVTRLDEKVLKLEIADKVRVDIARNAVVGYQGQEPVVTEAQSS